MLAFVLALLKIHLDIFLGGSEGDGTLEIQGQPSLINLITPQSLVCGSLECFFCDSLEEPDFYGQHYQFLKLDSY